MLMRSKRASNSVQTWRLIPCDCGDNADDSDKRNEGNDGDQGDKKEDVMS